MLGWRNGGKKDERALGEEVAKIAGNKDTRPRDSSAFRRKREEGYSSSSSSRCASGPTVELLRLGNQ